MQEDAAPISWVESPAAPLAGSLASADGAFGVVTCQQGLQFFPDRPAAIAEIRLAGFAAIGVALWEVLGDEVADRFEGGPWGMPETNALAVLFDSAKFADVRVSVHRLTVAFPGGSAQFLRSIAAGPIAADLAALPPERHAVFASTAEQVLAPMTTDGVLSLRPSRTLGLPPAELVDGPSGATA